MSQTQLKGPDITIHLAKSNVETKKFCMNCRFGIFSSKHRIVTIAEEDPLDLPSLSFPIKFFCPNCRTHYSIQTIL